MVLLGIVLILVAISYAIRFVPIFLNGTETTGIVQSLEQRRVYTGRPGGNRIRTDVYVLYFGDGVFQTNRLWLEMRLERTRRAFNVGGEITVKYSAGNPSLIIQSGFIGIRSVIIFVSVNFVFGLVMIWVGRQELKKIERKANKPNKKMRG